MLTTANSSSTASEPKSAKGEVMRGVSCGLSIALFCTAVRTPRFLAIVGREYDFGTRLAQCDERLVFR
jgi:hypothetical protein